MSFQNFCSCRHSSSPSYLIGCTCQIDSRSKGTQLYHPNTSVTATESHNLHYFILQTSNSLMCFSTSKPSDSNASNDSPSALYCHQTGITALTKTTKTINSAEAACNGGSWTWLGWHPSFFLAWLSSPDSRGNLSKAKGAVWYRQGWGRSSTRAIVWALGYSDQLGHEGRLRAGRRSFLEIWTSLCETLPYCCCQMVMSNPGKRLLNSLSSLLERRRQPSVKRLFEGFKANFWSDQVHWRNANWECSQQTRQDPDPSLSKGLFSWLSFRSKYIYCLN